LARVWQAESKLRVPLLRKTAYLVLPAAAGLLFQIYNYHYLYFYYITERVDANRHLPLSQSILHLGLAGSHLGVVTALCSLVVLVIRFGSHRAQSVRQIDWKIFWLAWAPALFLMLSGAGLNPFVSMPSVFGLLLFSYFPLREGIPVAGWKRSAVCLLLAGSSLFNAAGAKRPQLFIGANQTRMAGLKTLMDRINHDAAALRRPVVRYLIPELGDFHDCAFTDSLIYEYGGTPQPDGTIRLPSGVRYSSTRPDLFAAPDADFWKWNVPARGGSSEMDAVTSIAMSVPDYLLLPTGPTLAFLENRQAFKFINLKVRELKRRLLAIPVWTELGAPVAVSPDESIQLYSRIPAGSPAPRN
jgi:hypothetical protein